MAQDTFRDINMIELAPRLPEQVFVNKLIR
jgi:hypothetical protein